MFKFKLIDILRNTTIQRKYDELVQLEKIEPQELVLQQRLALTKLLIILKRNNNYYRDRLRGVQDSEIIDDPFTVLLSLPIVDKSFHREYHTPLFTPITKRPYQNKKTGGSTGDPLHYFSDLESVSYSWSFIYYSWHKYADYSLGNPFITIGGNSLKPIGAKFSNAVYYYLQNNRFISSDILDTNKRIQWHKMSTAKLLYGYPSAIIYLYEVDESIPSYLTNLRAVFTTSELLTPSTRRRIEEAFKVKVYDIYGANDGSLISCECREHNGYHYDMRSCYVEVENGAGDEQNLILTSLSNYTYPFVRYRVGDVGVIDETQCKCRLPFKLIKDLQGRTRDILYIKDRGFIHGSAVNSLFFRFKEITAYKIVQQKNYDIFIYISLTNPQEFNEFKGLLKNKWQEVFGGDPVYIQLMDTSTLNHSNKFQVIESNVNKDMRIR